jgi:hypothetical protein
VNDISPPFGNLDPLSSNASNQTKVKETPIYEKHSRSGEVKNYTDVLWDHMCHIAIGDENNIDIKNINNLHNELAPSNFKRAEDPETSKGVIELIFQAILMYVYCPLLTTNDNTMVTLMDKLKKSNSIEVAFTSATHLFQQDKSVERIAYNLILHVFSVLYDTSTATFLKEGNTALDKLEQLESRTSPDNIIELIEYELEYMSMIGYPIPTVNPKPISSTLPTSDKDMLKKIKDASATSDTRTQVTQVPDTGVHDKSMQILVKSMTNNMKNQPEPDNESGTAKATKRPVGRPVGRPSTAKEQITLQTHLMHVYTFILEHSKTRLTNTTDLVEKKLGADKMSYTTVKHYAAATKSLLNMIIGPQQINTSSHYYPQIMNIMCSSAFLNIQNENMNFSQYVENQQKLNLHGEIYSRNVSMFNLTTRYLVDWYVHNAGLISYSIYGAKNEFIDKSWLKKTKKVTIYHMLVNMFRSKNSTYDKKYTDWLEEKKKKNLEDNNEKTWEAELRDDAISEIPKYDFFAYLDADDADAEKSINNVAESMFETWSNNNGDVREQLDELYHNSDFFNDFFLWTIEYIEYMDKIGIPFPFPALDWDAEIQIGNDKKGMETIAALANVIRLDETANTIEYISCNNCNEPSKVKDVKKCDVNKYTPCVAKFTNVYNTMDDKDADAEQSIESIANDMMVRQTVMYNQGLIIMSFGGSGVGKTSLLFGVKDIHGGLIKSIYNSLPEIFYFDDSETNRKFSVSAYEIYEIDTTYNVIKYDNKGREKSAPSTEPIVHNPNDD